MYPEFFGHYFAPQQKGPTSNSRWTCCCLASRDLGWFEADGRGIETLDTCEKKCMKGSVYHEFGFMCLKRCEWEIYIYIYVCWNDFIWYPHEPHSFSTFNIKKEQDQADKWEKVVGPCVSPKRITRFQGGPTGNLTTYPPPGWTEIVSPTQHQRPRKLFLRLSSSSCAFRWISSAWKWGVEVWRFSHLVHGYRDGWLPKRYSFGLPPLA